MCDSNTASAQKDNYIFRECVLANDELDVVNIVDRMKLALDLKSSKELAKYLGVSDSSISNWIRRNTVPYAECVQITKRNNISMDWLLFGIGDSSSSKVENTPNVNSDEYVSVPMYDVTASAGNGCFFSEERIIGHLHYLKSWVRSEGLFVKDLAVVTISGDSMSPTLNTGDAVLINTAHTKGDGIFLLRVGEALRVKRLQWLVDNSIRVLSDNPMYPQEIISAEAFENNSVEVIGACHTRQGKLN